MDKIDVAILTTAGVLLGAAIVTKVHSRSFSDDGEKLGQIRGSSLYRFKDNEAGVVCYAIRDNISCVQLQPTIPQVHNTSDLVEFK